jgi:hypothetical protein
MSSLVGLVMTSVSVPAILVAAVLAYAFRDKLKALVSKVVSKL